MADLDEPIAGTDPSTGVLGRIQAMHIMLAGASAAKAGEAMTTVPHDGDSDDPVERASAQSWLRGWMSATRALKQWP